MKSLKIEDELHADLFLVKRVLGKRTMTEVIRYLMDARGYDGKWLEYMNNVLSQEAGE